MIDAIERVSRGVQLFKLAIVAGFLFVFPPICVAQRMFFAAAILGALGVLMDVVALRALFGSLLRETTKDGVAIAAGLFHAGIAIGGIAMLFAPMPGHWELVPGTEGWSDPVLARGPRGPTLALASGTLRVIDGPRAFEDLRYPGAFAWSLVAAPDAIWITPRDGAEVWRQTGEGWAALSRPWGYVGDAVAQEGVLFAVIESRLFAITTSGATPITEARVHDVATDGARVIAAGDRLLVSEDRGASFSDRGPTSMMHPEVFAGGGAIYLLESALLSSELFVALDGAPLERRELPVRDARVLAVRPDAGQELWVASWGEGVWRSHDGGLTWTDLGLEGAEIRTIVIDWEQGTAWVALSNLAVRSGVYRLEVGR